MERIQKATEEAHKIHKEKLLQLKSDYKKEAERLVEKYRMLLRNLNDAAAQDKKELDTNYERLLKNKLLAKVVNHNHEKCKRERFVWIEQGFPSAVPISSSSTHVSRHHPTHMPAQRLEQCKAPPPMIRPPLSKLTPN